MPKKEPPSVDWQRIYALPYNHSFKGKVKQFRSYLGLPVDGISDIQQAWVWLENHLKQKPILPSAKPAIPPWLQQQQTSSDERLWKTDVPLWQVAILLIADFGLPLRMRNNIGLYLVTNDEKFLTGWKGLDIDFAINVKAAKPQLAITVDGIDAWTTEQQWREVWDNWIKPLKRNLGEPIPANKRTGRGKNLQERIKTMAEWYELSELDGLGPAKALEKWEEQHLDYVEHRKSKKLYDVSTVTKAVEEFRRLITPTNP